MAWGLSTSRSSRGLMCPRRGGVGPNAAIALPSLWYLTVSPAPWAEDYYGMPKHEGPSCEPPRGIQGHFLGAWRIWGHDTGSYRRCLLQECLWLAMILCRESLYQTTIRAPI